MTNFKAPNEYAWAAWLDLLNIPYKYEALEERISRAIRYRPDFWLPNSLAWLEIKPARHVPTPGESRVAWQLVEATVRPCYLCAGWPSFEGLRVWLYRPLFLGTQEASDKAAIVWLAGLVNRRLPEVLVASRAVMARRLEFVETWQRGDHE